MAAISIEEALQRASFCMQRSGLEQSRSEAEILLSSLLNNDRLQLFLNRDAELSPELDKRYRAFVCRRIKGEPLAYITGEKFFYGYRFSVDRNVLIPRPETELIIDSALEWAKRDKRSEQGRVSCIDLGTGSGVIAVSLALKLSRALIWATDISGGALKVAQRNASLHNVDRRINWVKGSFFKPLDTLSPKPQFNLVVSNPPYISLAEVKSLPKGILKYEPTVALEAGEDGLNSYREILNDLAEFILSPGLVLFEIGAGQKEQLELLCQKTGLFHSISWRYDLAGWPRVFEGFT